MPPPTRMTFFRRLLPLVTSGQKTITIRDRSESHYQPGTTVRVYPLDDPDEFTCSLYIESVRPISWNDLDETHAQQEGMTLPELVKLLREIYPHTDELFIISFSLVKP